MSKKMKYILTIIIIVIVLSGITVPILGKYLLEKSGQLGIQADDFYFTSDLLEEPSTNNTFPEYTLGKGIDTISFKLNNYEDSLRFTKTDIKYNITVTNSLDVKVYETTGTITTGSEKNSVSINIPSLETGTYIVVVNSTSPYSKTLKGKFIIQELDNEISYTVSDGVGSTVVMLTISVNDYSGPINIKWPTGVSPDNSDPLLSGAIDCDNYTVNFNSYSEYTFVFFKTDSNQVYTNLDFTLTK